MSGYTKLFSSILASTVWREDNTTRIVWITLLAMSDKNGVAEGSIPGLADFARVSVAEVEAALLKLSSQDEYSRSKEHGGSRICEVDGGWQILNHAKYRAKMSADERREYLRVKQAEYRKQKSTSVNNVSDTYTVLTHTEADADAKADTKASTKAKKTTPRPLTAKRNLHAEFEHSRFDVPTSWHLRHVKDIREGEAGMMAFYRWLSERVDQTNEDTVVAGVDHGRFVWLDRCFADWMLSTRKAPAPRDTFAESQKRRQEELDANYDPRFEGLTMREKVELAKRLQAEEAEQS